MEMKGDGVYIRLSRRKVVYLPLVPLLICGISSVAQVQQAYLNNHQLECDKNCRRMVVFFFLLLLLLICSISSVAQARQSNINNHQLECEKNCRRIVIFFLLLLICSISLAAEAQQSYVNNHQLDCDKNFNETNGFQCNGPRLCLSYLTFRSAPPYDSPPTIAYLLNSDPAQIATINQISDVEKISKDTLVIVPVNCSCSGDLYQHNATYTLKNEYENYFSVANITYQGLTTCQALKAQNPYYFRNLSVGLHLQIPLMCACPTPNQTSAGFHYLLSYLVTWGDTISSIADLFGVDNLQSIYDANRLSSDHLIFPFTPLLVPLEFPPSPIQSPPPSPPPSLLPQTPTNPSSVGSSHSSKKWVFIGAGIGAVSLILFVSSGTMFCFFRRRRHPQPGRKKPVLDSGEIATKPSSKTSWSVSSEGIRFDIESLTVYKYEELLKAAGYFGESNRIKGCVYRASFKGDDAAIKMLKGDVSQEIGILKQINHSKVIRLSGICMHAENTYLVYEYAENGALSHWLHGGGGGTTLGWKQRVQIAHDVADALNYLHNFINPPCVHKNLKSSNILLDGNMRGKITNFGLARRFGDEEGDGLQLTRHVVGTKGYMAPEYLENGVVTPKLDVFAFGVVILELLSGKEVAASSIMIKEGGELLSVSINEVFEGDNVRDKLRGFIDPSLAHEYPFDLAFSMAQLAKSCVAHDLNARPNMSDIFLILSKILSSSLDWDSSNDFQTSGSLGLSI